MSSAFMKYPLALYSGLIPEVDGVVSISYFLKLTPCCVLLPQYGDSAKECHTTKKKEFTLLIKYFLLAQKNASTKKQEVVAFT